MDMAHHSIGIQALSSKKFAMDGYRANAQKTSTVSCSTVNPSK